MATVNRFSKPLQSQLINPLSLQDALVVPSFMRQQHNALSSVAAENAVLNSDSLGQDRELVQQLLSPIEQGYNEAAKTLAKNGFSQQRADEFLDLQGKKQRVEKDYLTNIAGRKQSVMAERERLAGLYDDEDTRASTLARFDLENSGKMTIDEDGKLQSPGLRTPRTYEIMSDKDMADLQLSAVSKLKAMVTSLGKGYKVDNITNMDQFSQAITDQKITELSPQRIQAVLQSVMGKETLDSYKQQGINRGLGWDQDQTKRYQTSYLQQKEAQLKQMQSAEKSNLKDGEKAQYTDNFIASQMDVLKQNVMKSDASELYARDQLNNNINNMSNAMAYREEDFDTKIISRPFELYMAKEGYDASMASALSPPTMPGIKIENGLMSPLANQVITDSSYGWTDALMGKDNPLLDQVLEENGWTKDGKQIFSGNVPVSPAGVQQALAKQKNIIENPATNPKVLKFISENPSLQKWVDDEIKKIGDEPLSLRGFSSNTGNLKNEIYAEAVRKVNEFYKNINQTYNLGIVLPQDVAKYAKTIYDQALDNVKIVDPKEGAITFEQMKNKYGIKDLKDFYENLQLKSTRNVFGHGNMIEAHFLHDDGEKSQGIFIESPTNVSINTAKTGDIDAIITSGDFTTPISTPFKNEEGRNVQEYVVPNFNNGTVMIQVKDVDTNKFIGQYSLQSLISEQDKRANDYWIKQGLIKGKAN